mmetsp:Transcript_24492/g.55268  ORF Transcript_24492/g.55268 Transcript_24492/m.55268 type:complete len:208 (-) Transcript_24492:147-770(-)
MLLCCLQRCSALRQLNDRRCCFLRRLSDRRGCFHCDFQAFDLLLLLSVDRNEFQLLGLQSSDFLGFGVQLRSKEVHFHRPFALQSLCLLHHGLNFLLLHQYFRAEIFCKLAQSLKYCYLLRVEQQELLPDPLHQDLLVLVKIFLQPSWSCSSIEPLLFIFESFDAFRNDPCRRLRWFGEDSVSQVLKSLLLSSKSIRRVNRDGPLAG